MQNIAKKVRKYYKKKGIKGVFRATLAKIKYIFVDKIQFSLKKESNENIARFESGSYKKKVVTRTIKRLIGRIIYWKKIKKNKRTKILVVLHFYYQKSADEIIQYLKNLNCYNYDLIVTCIKGQTVKNQVDKIKKFKPKVKILEYENKGYDIGPFIDVINKTDLSKYDIVIKLQTKSTDKSIYVYKQFFRGRDWFKNLFDGTIGCIKVHKTIEALQSTTKYGIVAAKNLIIHDPKYKQELVKETILNYKKIRYVDNYKFIAGSCFAIKAECLKEIQAANLSDRQFENTKYGFFSLAHVIERAICFSATSKYEPFGINVDFTRRMKWKYVEKELEKYHGLILDCDKKYVFSPDFIKNTMESKFISGYKTVKIRLGDIKRQYPDGKIVSLKQCEPYKYLEGDKEIYKKYINFHMKNNLPHMSEERFKKLILSIKNNGYNKKYPIVIDEDNIVWDGQHRACIMLFLFGERYKVDAIKVSQIMIDLMKIKPFAKNIEKAINKVGI